MFTKRQISVFLALLLMFFFSVDEARSQAVSPADNDRWEISLGGGYFLPAREGLREYYKNGPEAEFTVSRKVHNQFSARMDFFLTRLLEKKSSVGLELWTFSIVPSIKLTLRKAYRPYFGAGLGYYRGIVKYEGPYYPYYQAGGGEEEISKGGVGFKIYSGLIFNFTRRFFLGLEGVYCHTFLGDPYEGYLGNVGGFSALGKLGVSL